MNLYKFLDAFDIPRNDYDILLPSQNKMDILNWCRENNVNVECPLSREQEIIARELNGLCLWRIRDSEQRFRFMLKWL